MLESQKFLFEFIKKNKYIYGAELGIRQAHNADNLCAYFTNLRLICVDLWPSKDIFGIKSLSGETYKENESNYRITVEKLAKYKERIEIKRQYTLDAAKDIANESLDFVIIDATHSYNGVKNDIDAWLPKIKENGLICGHDYHISFDNGGVIRAVDELSSIKDDGINGLFIDPYTFWFIYKKNIRR